MNRIKSHHIISTLALGGIAFAAFNFNSQPLFDTTDDFILFAKEEIEIEEGVQVSSGNLGSNQEIEIDKDVLINGNLFSKAIELDKNVIINGDVSFKKLKTKEGVQILGEQITPVSLPIANVPDVADFEVGTQNFKFEGQTNILAAGSFRGITLEEDSRLTLTGSIYNLSKLILKDNSTLIFSTTTTLNIKQEFTGKDNVSIFPGQNFTPDDLQINFQGKKDRKDRDDDDDEDEDDDDDDNNGNNNKDDDDEDDEDDDDKDRRDAKRITFGKNSFLNFKLLAPDAEVRIGKDSILRGQILAKEIQAGKNVLLSREATLTKLTKQEDVISDPNGGVYPINEILLDLTATSTLSDAIEIATVVNGRVVGIISSINLFQIELQSSTIIELESVLSSIRDLSDFRIEGVFRNFIIPVE